MKTLLLLTTLALFASCDKETDCFQGRDKGDGTVSFYVDGKLWQNSCESPDGSSFPPPGGSGPPKSMSTNYHFNGHLSVRGKIWDQSTLYIGINDTIVGQSFSLGNGLPIYTGAIDPFDHCKITLFYKDKDYISKTILR